MSKNIEDGEKEKEKLRKKSLNREILAFTWSFCWLMVNHNIVLSSIIWLIVLPKFYRIMLIWIKKSFNTTLDFFKNRIRKFQEKKLNEILEKIQFHEYMKIQSEKKVKDSPDSTKLGKELSYHNLMIDVWKRNEEKLRTQMSEMED